MRTILIQLFAICSIRALENPVPSSFLQPRDFNPHPYRADPTNFLIQPGYPEDFKILGYEKKFHELSQRIQNTGPIQFPPNSDTTERSQQQLEQQRRIVSHIVEKQALIPHPYQKLAAQYRAQQLHRYSGNVDQAQIFSALASHGRRVQANEFQHKTSIPFVKHQNNINRVDVDYSEESDPIEPSSSNNEKKHYRFSYAVKDGHSGDDFSHSQKQENGAVQGSYKVHLPDGRVQIVKYTADDVNGYRADVTYEIDGQHQEPKPTLSPVHSHPRQFYPKAVKRVEINNVRHTVTPTPYISEDYNIRAPSLRSFYPSTTAIPNHHHYY